MARDDIIGVEVSSGRVLPEWIDVNVDKLEAVYKGAPERQDLSADINENLIVELYSK